MCKAEGSAPSSSWGRLQRAAMSCNHVHVNLARMVSASSPVRRRGSILNLAPSSSPTAISWPETGSKGPLLLCCHRAGTAAAAAGRAPRMRRDAGRRARGRDIMVGDVLYCSGVSMISLKRIDAYIRRRGACAGVGIWLSKECKRQSTAQGPVPS